MNIPLNIDWQQILLHLFNFSILVGGLYLLLFKPVKNFMDKRAKHYQDMETAAVEREKATAEMEAAMQQRQAVLDAELDEKRAAAAKEAEAFAQQQRDAAREQADKIVAAARENAENDRKKIVAEANREAVSIAEAAMEKLMRKLNRQKELVLETEDYKRPRAPAPSKLLEPWYRARSFTICHNDKLTDELFSRDIVERLRQDFTFLLPYYDYFVTLEGDPDPRDAAPV